MRTTVETLRDIPLFANLPDPELDALAAHMRELKVDTGTAVIREGEPGTEFFVLVAGRLEISIATRRVNVLNPGDFLGELALLLGVPRTATAVATEPSGLLVMNRADFDSLLVEHPDVETKVLTTVAQRLRYR